LDELQQSVQQKQEVQALASRGSENSEPVVNIREQTKAVMQDSALLWRREFKISG